MKKGYRAEYKAKQNLQKLFGKNNLFKIAIGGATDFLILSPKKNKILKLIEIKTTKKAKWYPGEHDFRQFKILEKIQKEHKIPVEYWIKIKKNWQILTLEKVKSCLFHGKRTSFKTFKRKSKKS